MWSRVKNSVVLNLVLLLLASLTVYGAFNLARYGLELGNESREAQKKIEELTRKKQGLERYRTELATKEAVERRAKERLNLKLLGEKVVVLVPQASSASPEGSGQFSRLEGVWTQAKYFFTRLWASFGFLTQ